MRFVYVALLTFLAACSGTSPSASTSSTGGEGAGRVRADLACTERVPTDESDCAARGCDWSAPLFCSGVRQAESDLSASHPDVTRPCTCVCESDRIACASVP